MLSHNSKSQRAKAGEDLMAIRASLRKNFQAYKPSIAPTAARMFWVSVAIMASFVISQVFILFTR